MASLWRLPIVFAIENNQYAMGTSVKRSSAETEFYRRGTSFRIPGMEVNGMDVLEVRQAAEVAFKHVREGNGPVLLELNTYRYRGHSMSDPAKYRTREEVATSKANGVTSVPHLALSNGFTLIGCRSEDEIAEAIRATIATIKEALDAA